MSSPILSLESIPPVDPYLAARRARADDYKAQLGFASMVFERELYYSAMYTPWGQYGVTPPDSHGAAWHPYPATAQGREALAAIRDLADPWGEQRFDLFGLKEEALRGLEAALRPRKSALNGYLLAARFAVDLREVDSAIAAVDVADRLSPDHGAALGYRYDATLLREPIGSPGAALVERRLRRTLGPDWSKGVTRGRERHEAQVRRDAWRARAAVEGERFTRFLTTERQWCENARADAVAGLDAQLVPESFRHLLPLARRYGIGDDPCRGYFIDTTPKRERKAHVALATPHLDDIQRWVATWEAGSLPQEAALFFWLLEAVEEMR